MLIVPITPVRAGYPLVPSRDGRSVSGLVTNLDLVLVGSNQPTLARQFRIDTGAACSGISLLRAATLGLLSDADQFPEVSVREAGGVPKIKKVRVGRLAAKVSGLRDEPFDWPVIFHDNWPEEHPLLLGLAGVVDDLTIHVDGSPCPVSAYGSVTISLRTSTP